MGDGRLLEEAVFRNCQFSQVGRAETVSPAKLAEAINSMLPAAPTSDSKCRGWKDSPAPATGR